MTDPDRLTDEARDELVERLETEACIAAKAEDGLCASLLREAAAALRSTPEAEARVRQLEEWLMAAAWPIHAMGDDHPDLPEWAREPIKWVRDLQARASSTPEAGTARVIPPLSDEARARQPDSCWADCGDHDWYCCGGEWDDPERREAIFAGSDAALRSTPEAGTGDETCPCCQRHCRRSPGFLEHGISLDMDLEVEAEERERGGPPSPLLALAEELEARADEQSGDYQVPIGDWSVRRWSQLRAWKGATLAYRKAAALARDYATREESDDD